jgi:hypothetical protein
LGKGSKENRGASLARALRSLRGEDGVPRKTPTVAASCRLTVQAWRRALPVVLGRGRKETQLVVSYQGKPSLSQPQRRLFRAAKT